MEDCETQTSHSSWGILLAVCSPQVPTRSQDLDIAAHDIRSLLLESRSQPPSIVTYRASSDLLYHQCGLQLVNVFNTIVGHIMVTNWTVKRKVTRVKRLYSIVLYYLGVVGHLPGPCHPDTGTE